MVYTPAWELYAQRQKAHKKRKAAQSGGDSGGFLGLGLGNLAEMPGKIVTGTLQTAAGLATDPANTLEHVGEGVGRSFLSTADTLTGGLAHRPLASLGGGDRYVQPFWNRSGGILPALFEDTMNVAAVAGGVEAVANASARSATAASALARESGDIAGAEANAAKAAASEATAARLRNVSHPYRAAYEKIIRPYAGAGLERKLAAADAATPFAPPGATAAGSHIPSVAKVPEPVGANLSPLEQAANEAAAHVEATAPAPAAANKAMLEPHAGERTVTLYRGEPAGGGATNPLFTTNEKYALNFAGPEGVVKRVDVPESVAAQARSPETLTEYGRQTGDSLTKGSHVLPNEWADVSYDIAAPKTAAPAVAPVSATLPGREAFAGGRPSETAAVADAAQAALKPRGRVGTFLYGAATPGEASLPMVDRLLAGTEERILGRELRGQIRNEERLAQNAARVAARSPEARAAVDTAVAHIVPLVKDPRVANRIVGDEIASRLSGIRDWQDLIGLSDADAVERGFRQEVLPEGLRNNPASEADIDAATALWKQQRVNAYNAMQEGRLGGKGLPASIDDDTVILTKAEQRQFKKAQQLSSKADRMEGAVMREQKRATGQVAHMDDQIAVLDAELQGSWDAQQAALGRFDESRAALPKIWKDTPEAQAAWEERQAGLVETLNDSEHPGFAYSPHGDTMVTAPTQNGRYVVPILPESEGIPLQYLNDTPEILDGVAKHYQSLFDGNPNIILTGSVDDLGNVHIQPQELVRGRPQALRLANVRAQESVFDLKLGEDIAVENAGRPDIAEAFLTHSFYRDRNAARLYASIESGALPRLTTPQADQMLALMDQRAVEWAAETGKRPDEYFRNTAKMRRDFAVSTQRTPRAPGAEARANPAVEEAPGKMYQRGVTSGKEAMEYAKQRQRERTLIKERARAVRQRDDLKQSIIDGTLPKTAAKAQFETKAQSTLEKFMDSADNPSTSRTPAQWQPLWDATKGLIEEAKTNPDLAGMLDELPDTFTKLIARAEELGWDPVHVRNFTESQVDTLVKKSLKLGRPGESLGKQVESGTRQARTLSDKSGYRSIESLVAAANEVTWESRTNAVVDMVEQYARKIGADGKIPDGWTTWGPTRAAITGTELESGARTAEPGSLIIPKSMDGVLRRYTKDYSHPVFNAIGKVTNPWREFILNLTPRWYVNNLLGNMILATVDGVRMRDWIAAWKDFKDPDGPFAKNPDVLGHWMLDEGPNSNLIPEARGIQGYKNTFSREGAKGVHELAVHRLSKGNSAIDAFARSAVYHKTLRTTGDAAKALERSYKALVDYGDLSNFEQQVVRSVVPFYAWQKGMLKAAAMMPVNHPSVVAAMFWMDRINKQLQQDAFGHEMPEGYSGLVKLPGGFVLNTRGWNPLQDSAQLATPDGIAESMNPFLKIGVQAGFHAPGFDQGKKGEGKFGQVEDQVDYTKAGLGILSGLPQVQAVAPSAAGADVKQGVGKFLGLPVVTDAQVKKIAERTAATEALLGTTPRGAQTPAKVPKSLGGTSLPVGRFTPPTVQGATSRRSTSTRVALPKIKGVRRSNFRRGLGNTSTNKLLSGIKRFQTKRATKPRTSVR